MKKILFFNGSPHLHGNTSIALELVEAELTQAEIVTERIQVGGTMLRGCLGCRQCWIRKNCRCVIEGDSVNDWIKKMSDADGFVLGSPVYTANITAELKAFIDRSGFVSKANDFLFRGKIGAPVVVGTKAGMLPAYQAIQAMFSINQMISVGSIHWNLAIGKEPGDVLKDSEGVETMKTLGHNIAKLLHQIS